MSFYFSEIKNRLFLTFLASFLIGVISYLYKETLIFILLEFQSAKSSKSHFIFTDVREILEVYLKIIYILTIQFAGILLFYHLFIFLTPAFFGSEYYLFRSATLAFLVLGPFSFLATNYFFVPLFWNFLLNFNGTYVNFHLEAKLNEFISFYISTFSASFIYFQGISLLMFLSSFYFFTFKPNFKKLRKFYYYFLVILSTIVTPPDIVSQVTISLILIFTYELLSFVFIFRELSSLPS